MVQREMEDRRCRSEEGRVAAREEFMAYYEDSGG